MTATSVPSVDCAQQQSDGQRSRGPGVHGCNKHGIALQEQRRRLDRFAPEKARGRSSAVDHLVRRDDARGAILIKCSIRGRAATLRPASISLTRIKSSCASAWRD
jgi:hypothetical protein